MAVPNTNTFTFHNVSDELYGDHVPDRNLVDSFALAVPSKFDVAYGAKTSNHMLAFRNYNGRATAWRPIYPFCVEGVAVTYQSIQVSRDFIRNNCGAGYSGSIVTYTLTSGGQTSTISQDDANQKAINYVLANGQTYANSTGSCSLNTVTYYNTVQSGYATKNDCVGQNVGSSVQYVVVAGTYTSIISQADANNKAIAEVAANKQAYANLKGTCSTGIWLKIGDSYKGGIVAYIVGVGENSYEEGFQHGVLAAPWELATRMTWWNGSYVRTYVWPGDIMQGYSSTRDVVKAQGAGNYAASYCWDLVMGGYDDWCLPCAEELTRMFTNRGLIGGFSDGRYWSSTERYGNLYTVKTVDFSAAGYSWQYTDKSALCRFRAIRYF